MSDTRWNVRDAEFDKHGRVPGTGSELTVRRANTVLFICNYLILTVFLGSWLSDFLVQSPLVNLVGSIFGFALVLVMRVLSACWWFVSGHDALFNYFKNSPVFGNLESKGTGFIGLILLIVLVIGIRTYRKSYVSVKTNQRILIGNSLVFIILGIHVMAW